MAEDEAELIVDGFLKNDHEMVLGKIREFHGKHYVDLRIYIPNAVEVGKWIPTPKGVMFSTEIFDAVQTAVRDLWDALDEETIGRVPKNKREELWIGVHSFKGNEYCFIRVYYCDKSGEWRPTKKGISIPTGMLSELDTLLDAVREKLDDPAALQV